MRVPPRFASLSRRAFVGWLGALPAARALPSLEFTRHLAGLRRALDPALLTSLAGAVLPSELGPEATRRVASAFARWADGYAPGAELDHPYGASDIARAGADPSPAWARQLATLERDARSRHGRGFARLTVAERQALVRMAIDGSAATTTSTQALPAVAAAPHVAIALMSHFFASSEATDLLYGVAIGKQRCRPLAAQRAKPVPLTRAARGG
jgi:hypothetical protein